MSDLSMAFILIIILVIAMTLASKYNTFTTAKNKVIKAKGTIDVYLKQRFDLIPNLVDVVKAYSNYEESTLKELIDLRTKYQSNDNKDIKNESEMNENLTRLIGVIEAYPNLKASENYLDLQHQLEKVENELQAARRLYNEEVTEYNDMVQTFPGNFFAALFDFKVADLFSVSEEEKENIDVNLDNK